MELTVKQYAGQDVAVLESRERQITDVDSALDLIMTVWHQSGCNRVVVHKDVLAEDFFVLSTRLAGEILQKFVNYRIKLAVYGDFSHYTSKPLRDFIYESNNGNSIFFAATLDEAVERVAKAR